MKRLYKIEYWVLGIITAYTAIYLLPRNIIQVLTIGTEFSIYYWVPSFLLIGYCFIKMIMFKEKEKDG